MKFGPNLHSHDDVIWYWSYNKKWSPSHDLFAHKIWTKLDQWLLSYETNKNVCCAHAHCECLVRFTTGYLDRVHGYQQKSSMTLYLLNVIFTFKLTLKGLNFGPNLHIKMTSHDLVLFIRNDCLVMMYLQTKFRRIRISGYWNIKQR